MVAGRRPREKTNRTGGRMTNKHSFRQPRPTGKQFHQFMAWAGANGYDCAHTCNSDTGEWIALNPMTADLWKAWKTALTARQQALQPPHPCTCRPDDNPPVPCAQEYALSGCKAAAQPAESVNAELVEVLQWAVNFISTTSEVLPHAKDHWLPLANAALSRAKAAQPVREPLP